MAEIACDMTGSVANPTVSVMATALLKDLVAVPVAWFTWFV